MLGKENEKEEEEEIRTEENPLAVKSIGSLLVQYSVPGIVSMLVVLPMILGIDGIMYVGPVSDGLAVAVAVVMVMLVREFRKTEYRINRVKRVNGRKEK